MQLLNGFSDGVRLRLLLRGLGDSDVWHEHHARSVFKHEEHLRARRPAPMIESRSTLLARLGTPPAFLVTAPHGVCLAHISALMGAARGPPCVTPWGLGKFWVEHHARSF